MTNTTNADNFLVRWASPIKATGIFVFGSSEAFHDGNAQIDAVIVSADAAAVPEPSSIALCAPFAVTVLAYGVNKRRKERARLRPKPT